MKIYGVAHVLDDNAVTLRGVIAISCLSYLLGSYHAHRWHMKALDAIRQQLAEESGHTTNNDASNPDRGCENGECEHDSGYDS